MSEKNPQRSKSRGREGRQIQALAVRNSQTTVNNVLRPIQNLSQNNTDTDDVTKKLDRILHFLNDVNESVQDLRQTVNRIESQTNQTVDKIEQINNGFIVINDRRRSRKTGIKFKCAAGKFFLLFSSYFIIKLIFFYNGHHLLNTPFNNTNVNLFGTRLLDILFTRQEQSRGSVEPARRETNRLDQDRTDLTKVCYLRKVRSI
ncbi:unnamed protein product [Brachionus calyciflorus]|uniref:Uncharacterized protein n=1 Tax=Brachionus calyciflorus TaxID=104777 RepID=A0A814GME2_9BILA|nr:unnamed protein product [Brachionus calyciflorus]